MTLVACVSIWRKLTSKVPIRKVIRKFPISAKTLDFTTAMKF